MTTSPNQAIEPGAQRPPLPPTQRPTRVRRYGWWLLAIAIIAAGIIGYVMYTRPATPAAPAGAAATAPAVPVVRAVNGNRPLPVIAQAAKTGDMDVYLSALGAVVAQGSVTVRPARRRPVDAHRVPGGADGQGRRSAGRDRSASVPGAADPGRGPDGEGPGAAQECPAGCRTLHHAVRARLHREAAGRHPDSVGAANTKARSRPTRDRSTARSSSSLTRA